MSIDRAEQERLRKLAESQQVPVTTIKASKKAGAGLKDFLNRKDPNLETLKKQYFDKGESATKSAYKPSDTQF